MAPSVVLSSSILLVWLLAATLFEWLYKPAQQGRKVAYLTVASFLFLALVMAMLLLGGSEHGRTKTQSSKLRVHHSSFIIHHSSFARPRNPPFGMEANA